MDPHDITAILEHARHAPILTVMLEAIVVQEGGAYKIDRKSRDYVMDNPIALKGEVVNEGQPDEGYLLTLVEKGSVTPAEGVDSFDGAYTDEGGEQ